MTQQQPKVGDQVKLISVPDWLLRDIPVDEQHEIRSCVGKVAVISEIDSYGYFWVGFGGTVEGDESARYSGHSFCVSRECLEPL